MGDDITVEFVTGPDSEVDKEELERLTLSLRQEIGQLEDVDKVEQASAGPAPDGTRAGELAAIGKLIVSAVPGVEAAAKVLDVIRIWLGGRASGAPTLKMTIGGNSIEIAADDDQQDALVAQFIKSLQSQTAPSAAPTAPATEG
jgi:hypothetical protein